eukprot:TRINITY_DN3189_c0_g1_i6.p1 TRINITY_DN3189_c0_g1~~TRINITY_DN3189_c0_g1_i6.p1  ORF type:complete len:221 (-),score=49.40 TRINITY_DN3189_c0_g1_i6:806-1468(-)
MIRRPPRSTLSSSSAASDVYKRQAWMLTGTEKEDALPGPAPEEAVRLTNRALESAAARSQPGRELKAPAAAVSPKPWWLCLELDRLSASVAKSGTEVLVPPFESALHRYYEQAAYKRLEFDLASPTEMKLKRMEIWPGALPLGGRVVFADIEHKLLEGSTVASVELLDDGFREPTSQLASFAAHSSPVVCGLCNNPRLSCGMQVCGDSIQPRGYTGQMAQ